MKNSPATQLGDLIVGIDHVAIAVEDLDASIAWYVSALGFSLVERSEVAGELSGMRYAVMKAGSANAVLVQGTSPESQVSRFIAEFGPGIQHIAFAVTNLDRAIERATAAGSVTDTAIVSDNGMRQIFLQRDPATGVRVELIERNDVPFSRRSIEQLFKAVEEKDVF